MNYNEWRDELKNNLLSVTESERRRVLEYYAEAYADRREAGFSEREIIAGFGAPYDAAQRILCEGGAGARSAPADDPFPEGRPDYGYDRRSEGRGYNPPPPPPPQSDYRGYNNCPPQNDCRGCDGCPPPDPVEDKGHPVLFAIFLIIFSVPLLGIIIGLAGISIGLCVAPFAVLVSGVAVGGAGVGSMVAGELYYGLFNLGAGIIIFGVGIILISVFTRIVKLLWWLWSKAFGFVKSLFCGRARA